MDSRQLKNKEPLSTAVEIIPVNKPFLPSRQLFDSYVDEIWKNGQLTNRGALHIAFEDAMLEFSGSKYFHFLNNGTLALNVAIKALDIQGEVITTPFSYVATTSTLVWENCTPVFADIDPHTWNISPESIAQKINANTRAIVATHVYGNACDVDAIASIANAYNIPVIYDAAHAFGSTWNGQSLFLYGDIATASFHATKLFHTTEGGGIFTQNDALAHRVSYMRNFGHNGQEAFWGLGINAKNSELHAAMGLALCPSIPQILEKRIRIAEMYDTMLKPLIESELIQRPQTLAKAHTNHAYYAILIRSESELLKMTDFLHAHGVFPRRYFYPGLNQLPYVEKQTRPISDDYSPRVVCLPSYFDLSFAQVERVAALLLDFFKSASLRP